MKRVFLLDENILILAIKGEDDRGNKDPSAAKLVRLVAQNCHRIALSREVSRRYRRHLKAFEATPFYAQPMLRFWAQLLVRNDKVCLQHDPLPVIPPEVVIPLDDHPIVICALAANALLVTTDGRLKGAIEACPALGLSVLSPVEALALAASL